MNPLTLIYQSGGWGIIIAIIGVLNLLVIFAQLPLLRKINLMPLAWAGVFAIVLCGMLGSVFGMMMAFEAVAMAPPEFKQAMLAQGFTIALNTTALSLMIALVEVGLVGIFSCLLANLSVKYTPTTT